MKFLKGQSNDDLNKFYKFDTFYRDQSLAWKWVKYIANINDNKHAFLLTKIYRQPNRLVDSPPFQVYQFFFFFGWGGG